MSENISSDQQKFNLGYALKSWDALSQTLLDKGFSEEILIKAGLAKKNKDGKLFDVFRNRLIFPLRTAKEEL